MKILKILLGLLLLLALLFIGKGFLTPSVYYESKIEVNKPAAEAWAVMSDDENLPKWLEGFVKSELISGTANTKGAVSKIYINEGGKEMTMEETINEVRLNEYLDMTFTMDFMNMDYKLEMNENNGKTTITTKSKTIGNGMLAKSIVAFMPKAMKAQEDKNLSNLKNLIEANSKNYFPEAAIELGDTLQIEQ